MYWLKVMLAEIVGLFVDDGALALSVIVWLGVTWLVLPHIKVPAGLSGIILFIGLALILIESVTRRSKR